MRRIVWRRIVLAPTSTKAYGVRLCSFLSFRVHFYDNIIIHVGRSKSSAQHLIMILVAQLKQRDFFKNRIDLIGYVVIVRVASLTQ